MNNILDEWGETMDKEKYERMNELMKKIGKVGVFTLSSIDYGELGSVGKLVAKRTADASFVKRIKAIE